FRAIADRVVLSRVGDGGAGPTPLTEVAPRVACGRDRRDARPVAPAPDPRRLTMDVVRTYLELTAPDQLRPAPTPIAAADARVERLAAPTPAQYLALYRTVGEAYHWRDRLAWSEQQLADYLARPDVAVWVLRVGGDVAGYFELLDTSAYDGSVEIVYFGLVARYHGRGLGKFMLTRAVEEAWRARGATRVWLHTCTLDGPAALPNYLARGFRAVRTEHYQTDVGAPAPAAAPG
ncbi:MAG TPA: GNAT family N-acetyltransferase, partial [Gemmatimonadaceae bacterium]|nr:GNAT family N-acetyltransferase [Gemmatimonadaceae bacterium]